MGGGSEGIIMRMLSGDPRTAQEMGLSDEQIKAIKDAMASADKEMTEMNVKLVQVARHQSELWKAEPFDEEALMKAAAEAGDISSQIAKLRVKHAITAFKILTPEQRAKLREAMKQRVDQGPQQWMQPGGPRGRQPGVEGLGTSPTAPLTLQPAITAKPPTPASAPAAP